MQDIPTKVINYKRAKIGFIYFFSKHKRTFLPFIFIFSYVLFYFVLDFSSQSLVAHDEGLYARRSRLVEESFNWFDSPFDKAHHKTIGSYWLIALSIRLFGYSELSLRFPSLLASFVCLFISYLIALKISNKKTALISVFSLSSMPLWIQYSRYASPDFPFVLCILLVIFFFIKFLDTPNYKNKYLYIFFSGLFISTAFFIRSYMLFVPLLGLTPFLLYHLFRSKNIFKCIFSIGILFGAIPTFINLYFSYKRFGMKGITLLFDFAKDKAIGGFDFHNFLLIPLNYIYLTFPIGFIFCILFVFTRSNSNINYPLLVYFYPIFSFSILLLMSTSYIHYYLFLLPSLSILFAVKLDSHSFRFSSSKIIIRNSLSFFILLICCLLLSLPLYYNDFLIEASYGKILLVYIIILFLILSFIASLRYLFDNRKRNYDLIKFFYNLIVPQYVSISLLYNFGIVGNPNFKLKSFLTDKEVSSIIKNNTIYLYNVDSKINTLLRYYLPSANVIKSANEIFMYNYIITSDLNSLRDYQTKSLIKSIKNFDNHFLLMNISK